VYNDQPAIAQETSIDQVVVTKLGNFYRARKWNRQEERLAAPTLLIFIHVHATGKNS
jgi:hypothetical protein